MPTVIAPYGCYLVAIGDNVEPGDHVEVDDETARSLIDQGWRPAEETAPSKAPPRARTTAKPAETTEE